MKRLKTNTVLIFLVLLSGAVSLPLLVGGCNNTVRVNYNNPLDPSGTDYIPAPPDAPQQLTATIVADSAVILNWIDTTRTINGFVVERKIGEGGDFALIGNVPVNTDSFWDRTTLELDTTYYYRVAAYIKSVQGAYTPDIQVSVRFPSTSTPTVIPLSATSLRISWLYREHNQTGFELERSLNGGPFQRLAITDGGTPTYVDNDIDTADTYSYRIAAIGNGSNEGPWSPVASVEYTATGLESLGSVNLGSPVNSVVFSPDGSLIAAVGTSSALMVWNTSNLTLADNLKSGSGMGSAGWPLQVAFSPDGTLLASDADGSNNAKVNVWRVSDGSLVKQIHGSGGLDARSIAITPDDDLVITGDFGGRVRFWSISRDSLVLTKSPFGISTEVNLLSFTVDGYRLIVGSYGFPGPTNDGLLIWNTSDWSRQGGISGFDGEFYSISEDNRFFTVNGSVGEVSAGKITTSLAGFQFGQLCLTFDDRLIIGKEYAGTISIGDATDGTVLLTKSMSAPSIDTYPALASSPNLLVFAAAGAKNGEIDIWEIRRGWRSK